MNLSPKKRKDLLAKSLIGDWRDRDFKYQPAATHCNTEFHERMKARRAAIPVVAVVKVN